MLGYAQRHKSDDQAPKVLIQVDIEFVFDRHPLVSSCDLATGPIKI
jgi:hypothetical protein